jgi:hypothetical protein
MVFISVFASGCVILGLVFWGNTAEAKDPPSPNAIPNPSRGTTESPQAKIMQALQGDGPAKTGDGVLEDILEIAKQRGSILDGSVLDGSVLDGGVLDGSIADGGIVDGDQSSESLSDGGSGNPPQNDSALQPARTARVAEQLLKAARLLASVSKDDSNDLLINAMRNKARDLLIDTKEETR